MIVILINGVSLSGKDTFVRLVKEEVRDKKLGLLVSSISTIDPIKDIYSDFFGWDGEKTNRDRKNLNVLKNVWVEVSNGPVKYAERILKSLDNNTWNDLVFIMVREYSEMISLQSMVNYNRWKCLTLCVQRDGIPIPPIEQEFLDGHPSDYEYDVYVFNPTVDTYPDVPKLKDFAEFFCKSMLTYGEK